MPARKASGCVGTITIGLLESFQTDERSRDRSRRPRYVVVCIRAKRVKFSFYFQMAETRSLSHANLSTLHADKTESQRVGTA